LFADHAPDLWSDRVMRRDTVGSINLH
jgi:hypothetical protein